MFDFAQPLPVDSCLTLPERVLLSPMQGVMSPFFASALQKMDLASTVITPFISVGSDSVPSCRALRKLLAPWPVRPGHIVIVQLMGRDPDAFAETALHLGEIGYPFVNLNFACPAPTVVRAGHGGACLREPRLIERSLSSVIRAGNGEISLSVKLRCGWNSPEEIPELAKMTAGTGVSLAVVHFRTVSEMYSPVPEPLSRLICFRKHAQTVKLIGNGNIASYKDALAMCEAADCSGTAVARAIMSDPMLLRRIANRKESSPTEKESDRMNFLRTIYHASKGETKWRRNGFLECVRMCLKDSPKQFRDFAKMSDHELELYFS